MSGGKKTWKNFGDRKDATIRARMDPKTIEKLDKCCEYYNTTRSDILRKGIEQIFEEIPKK